MLPSTNSLSADFTNKPKLTGNFQISLRKHTPIIGIILILFKKVVIKAVKVSEIF